MTTDRPSPVRPVVWVLVVVLAVAHQDLWAWDDRTLLLGFLPLGLAYHAAFSIACAAVWALAVKFAWPHDVEAWAEGGPGAGPEAAS
jgi:hypothetical protein